MDAAYDLIQFSRREWIMEDQSPPSSPMQSPPHACIENDDDHWEFPQPNSNEESRVRHSGPELARIFENFAEIDARISRALFEAEQRNWAAICKRRSKLKNQLDLVAALPKEDLRDKREDRLKGGKIGEEMGTSLEQEDAAVGNKHNITGRKYRDISEIVAEVMEARKALEMEGIPI